MSGPRSDFGDPAAEWRAAFGTVALADAGDLARLIATGPDLLALLQRLSTGDVAALGPGEGRATVITTNKGRIVQRLWVSHLGDSGVLLLGGAGGAAPVLEHLKRYTFAEDTGLRDATDETALFVLTGPDAAAALGSLGVEAPPALGARTARVADTDVFVIGCDGMSPTGCALVVPAESAEAVWQAAGDAVAAVGGRVAGSAALESARVLRGLAAHGHELTEAANPLEAGQRDAVSFTKGCYVGQEVVARLENYDKVARILVGIEFPPDAPLPAPETPLAKDGREVGRVTSAVVPAGLGRGVGLAYVKHRDAGPGDTVAAAGVDLRLVALPFAEAADSRP